MKLTLEEELRIHARTLGHWYGAGGTTGSRIEDEAIATLVDVLTDPEKYWFRAEVRRDTSD